MNDKIGLCHTSVRPCPAGVALPTRGGRRIIVLAIALLGLAACGGDSVTGLPTADGAGEDSAVAVPGPDSVSTLSVTLVVDSTVTVSWMQVGDGTGVPAEYRVKYAEPSIEWPTASIGCSTVKGTLIGASSSCTVAGLTPGNDYEFQLVSYRRKNGARRDTTYSNVAVASPPGAVDDLAVTVVTDSSLTVRWTEVDDGTGLPASYRVKYALPSIDWSSATVGCDRTITGSRIGAQLSCTISGLSSATTYDVQLRAFRAVDGVWEAATSSNVATGTTAATTSSAGPAGAVDDLAVAGTTDSGLTVRWTQVDDGTGQPASYRVKYALTPIDWSSATVGCDRTIIGTEIGAELSCTITGLPSATTYEVQLRAFRVVDGVWQGATPSNVATGTTGTAGTTGVVADQGIWMSASRLQQLPTSGPAWENVLAAANLSCGTVDLSDQEQTTNVCVMAKALVFARTGGAQYRADVVSAIEQIVSAPTYVGRALSLGRELGAYVIAADLIDLSSYDPVLDEGFRTALRALRTTYTSGAAASLIDCHERRPNNWGAHCGATRVAIAVYLGDDADLARAAQVFKGYLGDRSSYAGFAYGSDLSWQCDPLRPVGINPVGCERSGLSLDGVLPDDQRRGGSFTTSPPDENYVWEAMQGLLAQAVILERAGFEPFEWEDRALLRAARWLHDVNDFPAQGDDTWQAPLLNHIYGTTFPEQVPTRPGKNVGWTDWTHS